MVFTLSLITAAQDYPRQSRLTGEIYRKLLESTGVVHIPDISGCLIRNTQLAAESKKVK